MANNEIGCRAGRTKIIDPNDFNGFNSSSNMSVPLEDLNISVVLTTTRKPRTVLTSEGAESIDKFDINFIEGTKINDKLFLTTKYTDLTTSFDKDTHNDETLGITNIEIDFNSSYAPMVTINFIDVRGSSIFQNEEQVSDNRGTNKYSAFFQLPYPIFELEVKGYYGKPVTYCLHMLKFNSKFNSQTGNFEIQCEFIGYTYAMLSDLLVGYLKAIPKTSLGQEKYDLYNQNRAEPILTFLQLIEKINSINKGIEKLTSNSDTAVKVDNGNKGIEILDNIEKNIKNLGIYLTDIKKDTSLTKYPYMVKQFEELDGPEVRTTLGPQVQALQTYNDNVEADIAKFNELDMGTSLDINYFENISTNEEGKGKYVNLTLEMLNPESTAKDEELKSKVGTVLNLATLKEDLHSFIIKNFGDIKSTFTVYNFTGMYSRLNEARLIVSKNHESSRKSLAIEIKESIRVSLGISPTVRNIIEIYTAAAEVFLETIYQVSVKAEATDNDKRVNELKKVFGDAKTNDLKPSKFYAWPDYKERDENGIYTQKYLGTLGVLDNASNVDEVVFIEDLFNAFIKAAQEEQNAQNILDRDTKLWYPVNPLDSKLFNEVEPYSRFEILLPSDVIRNCVIRGMTFLTYTNKQGSLMNFDIMAMARAEAQAMLRSVTTEKIKQALSFISDSTDLTIFTNVLGKINGNDVNVVKLNSEGKGYYYNYIFDGNTEDRAIIPINKNFTGEWSENKTTLKNLRDNEDYLFLTNYSQFYGKAIGEPFPKKDDGGIYIKIKTLSDYTNSYNGYTLNELPEGGKSDSLLILEKLKADKVDKSSGFNILGGPLGIQDFDKIVVDSNEGGVKGGKPMAMKLIFYSTNFPDQPNGLARSRKGSDVPIISKFDLTGNNGTVIVEKKIDMYGLEDAKFHKSLGMNRFLLNQSSFAEISYPYFEQPAFNTSHYFEAFGSGLRKAYDYQSFSLFGSKFYYAQKTELAKAFLFLNNIPFNKGEDGSPFGKNEIKHLFDTRAGFIHVPKLWCAWVGSLLWRFEFHDTNDPILWTEDGTDKDNADIKNGSRPKTNQYLTWLSFGSNTYTLSTFDINNLFVNLPDQAKNEFKQSFFNFVDGIDSDLNWNNLKSKLEIWNGSSSDFNTYVTNLANKVRKSTTQVSLKESDFASLANKNNYSIMSPILTPLNDETPDNHYLFLELAGDYNSNEAVRALIDTMLEEVVIVNTNYQIWQDTVDEDNKLIVDKENTVLVAAKENFELYFNTIKNTIKNSKVGLGEVAENKEIISSIFGSSDENVVKLLMYKHCKNIHDKWLAGVISSDKIIYQCGVNRSMVDTKLAKKYGNKVPKLIDSFRFVSRSFEDIGDKLFINPLPINNYLTENQNASIYDSISSLLNSNKFEFIALPTYINFRDDEQLTAIFKPYGNYGQSIASSACGPTFVCVYAGEKSKHLAIANADYPNDSFDLRCIKTENGTNFDGNVPSDFSKPEEKDGFEDPIGVFTVKYSQQNQNIFKDITLDQSEFSETEESLKIMDEISQKGAETNRSFAGQNLYNVYSVRSYNAQIEMMGNAMIQPMMYFQLDNIPMFHGAYMITRVKHSIKPNHMSTNFTGVRIKYSQTKLLDAYDVFMPLIDSLATLNSTGTQGGLSMNYIDSYFNDLIAPANIPKDKNIKGGTMNRTTLRDRGIKEFSNWESGKLQENDPKALPFLTAYAKETPVIAATQFASNKEPWSAIFVSYIMLGGDLNFPKAAQHYTYVTSAMHGTGGYEVFPLKAGKGLVITPEIGDIFCRKRSDKNYTASHCDVLYKIEGNVGHLLGGNRSVQGGSPNDGLTVNDGTITFTNGSITDSTDVKTYKLLVKKTDNKYYNKKKLINTGADSSEIVNLETGSNADYWALVAICALESGEPEGRSDVAQSIYNRLLSKKYGKHTIKELIVAKGQYEPVGYAPNEFRLVKDKQTAINAVRISKSKNPSTNGNWSEETAKKHVEETIKAINNADLIASSQKFVQGRTDFNSTTLKKGNDRDLKQRHNQTFGWFVGAEAIKYGNYGKEGPEAPTANKPAFTGVDKGV